MFIYLLTQNAYQNYDTFDSIVVCAESEEDAKNVKPLSRGSYPSWATELSQIEVKLIGTATGVERGIILESFNAG